MDSPSKPISKDGGTGAEAEIEVAEGKSIHLELDIKEDMKGELSPLEVADSGTRVHPIVEMTMEELETSLKNLTLKNDINAISSRTALISKLGQVRTLAADKERLARKAAWIAQTSLEVQKRKESQEKNLKPNMLPNSDWKKVRPDEKAMLSATSLLWRDLLKENRTTFLFHEVFILLLECGSMLSRDTILECRVVCKEWKVAIVNTIQNLLDSRSWPDIEGVKYAGPKAIEVLPISFDTINFHFMGLMLGVVPTYDPGNIFISRKICLGRIPSSQMEWRRRPWDVVESLLSTKWGSEIWQVLFFTDRRLTPSAAYDDLCKFLTLMPNLRILAVIGNEELFHGSELVNVIPKPRNEYYNPLVKHMAKNPLPALSHLKTLITNVVPASMAKEMLKAYGATIDTCSVCDANGSPNIYAGNIALPQLKRFYINDKYLSLEESRFTGNWSNLEDLHVMYQYVEAEEILKLFQCLNGLGGSLRNLVVSLHKLDGPYTKADATSMKTFMLELPKVKRFSLALRRVSLKTMDFIMPMISLKELAVTYVKHVSSATFEKEKIEAVKLKQEPRSFKPTARIDSAGEAPEEIIGFGSYANRMYDSNIWTLFPELKKVTIEVISTLKMKENSGRMNGELAVVKERVYTREGYKGHLG